MKKLNLNENAYLSSDYYRKRENNMSKDLEKDSHTSRLNYQSAPISFRERRKMILLQKNATRDEIPTTQETVKQREMNRRSSKGSECLHKPKKLSNEFGPSYSSYFNLSRNSRQYDNSVDSKHDEFQNLSALLYQKKPDSSTDNKGKKSQEHRRMPPRNNSVRYLIGKENVHSHSQKSLSRIPPVENSMKTNKEEILNSISVNATKENKSSLQQKLNILGKILSKGKDPASGSAALGAGVGAGVAAGVGRKKSENFSNYSSLFYLNTSNNISKDGAGIHMHAPGQAQMQKVKKDPATSLDPLSKKSQPKLQLINDNKKKQSASPMFVKVNLLLANKENIPNNTKNKPILVVEEKNKGLKIANSVERYGLEKIEQNQEKSKKVLPPKILNLQSKITVRESPGFRSYREVNRKGSFQRELFRQSTNSLSGSNTSQQITDRDRLYNYIIQRLDQEKV